MTLQKIKFKKALLKDQWHDNVCLTISNDGLISDIQINDTREATRDIQVMDAYALPGMANVHSHAFQRAMAGLAEYATSATNNLGDSFWTWRDVMYRFAQKISPEDLYHIARQLYLEMVLAGYTTVGEFHYLHHQPGGQPYDNPAEMSIVIAQAAKDAGLNLTHLPVLYMSSGFGGSPLNEHQARFGHTVDHYCRLLDHLHGTFNGNQSQKFGPKLGIAFHSLRAVPPEAINEVITHLDRLDPTAPRHIHIAEQMKEVEDCLNWSGQRPVEWLLDHQDLDERWCLIHATHMTIQESESLAKTGAVAGLCPTTEANLGDGLFSLKQYFDQGGRIAIGSDSQISVSPLEELRLLEYGQRLKYHSRNIGATDGQPHTGTSLYLNTLKGGARATGFDCGVIEVGRRADMIMLDPASPLLIGTPDKYLLDRLIFSGNQSPVKHVMIGGKWVVRDRTHPGAEEITNVFRNTMERLAKILD